jgi:hypothetical protein
MIILSNKDRSDQMLQKTWTPAEMKELVASRNDAVEHAIIAIYKFQTPDEQGVGVTYYDNKVGFSGAHAEFCTSLAEQLKAGRHLSCKQMTIARKYMLHYSKQLAMIANGTLVEQPINSRRIY